MSKKKENTIVKDAIILCIITLVAGFLLGFVYELTAKGRQKAADDTKQEAYGKIFKGDYSFEEAADYDDEVADSAKYFKNKSYSYNDITYSFDGLEVNELVEVKAKDSTDEIQGYIVTVTTPNGYGGDIKLALGVDMECTVKGVSILDISETPGLGMNATGDFKEQFAGKNVDGFVHTKTGSKSDNEVDAITSATITTKAVTGAVDAGLMFVRERVMNIDASEVLS